MKDNNQYTYDEYDDDYYYDEEEIDEEEYANYQEEDYEYDDDYDDEYDDDNQKFDIKNLFNRNKLLTIFLVVVAVTLLIFTGNRILSNNHKEEKKSNIVVKNKEVESNMEKDIESIKEKMLNYYNSDNVPKEIDDENSLTLKELKEKNIVDKLSIDNYDLEKSYVKITKEEDSYKLDIYLNNNKYSKSKTFEVNHYDYCTNSFLCIRNDKLKDSIKPSDKEISEKENKEEEKESTSKDDNKENSKTYVYKYVKRNGGKLSNWSLWTNYQRTDCNTTSTTCEPNDTNCLKEVKLFQRKERIGSYPKVYRTTKSALVAGTTETKKACSTADYVKINGNYYQIPLNSNYQSIIGITSNTKSTRGSWVYHGRRVYQTPPADSINTKYIYVGFDDSNCGDTCSNLPNYIYDVYTFNKSMSRVSSTATGCKSTVSKQIPSYSILSTTVSITRDEGIYGTVCYASSRTRKIEASSNSDVKWSSYNNKELLNNGYQYTGEKKEK